MCTFGVNRQYVLGGVSYSSVAEHRDTRSNRGQRWLKSGWSAGWLFAVLSICTNSSADCYTSGPALPRSALYPPLKFVTWPGQVNKWTHLHKGTHHERMREIRKVVAELEADSCETKGVEGLQRLLQLVPRRTRDGFWCVAKWKKRHVCFHRHHM